MDFAFEALAEKHREQVVDILNFYIKSSSAAYREEAVAYPFYDELTGSDVVSGYAMVGEHGYVIGFGVLEKYKPISTFSALGDCMYFFRPEGRRRGLGSRMLARFEDDARKNGMSRLLVDISDENADSLGFHLVNGFTEYGRLNKCWRKFGRDLGVVYLAKELA
jgi:phosphinothricin acetyltransferase